MFSNPPPPPKSLPKGTDFMGSNKVIVFPKDSLFSLPIPHELNKLRHKFDPYYLYVTIGSTLGIYFLVLAPPNTFVKLCNFGLTFL